MSEAHKPVKTLKDLRLKTGLTQYALSEVLGVRGKTVGEWERGQTEPHIPVSKVLLLCQTLDCSLEELVEAVKLAKNSRSLESDDLAEKHLVAV